MSWQGLAAIITRENEGSRNRHLNILYIAPKESAADCYFLPQLSLPWQDLFLLQCYMERKTLDVQADGRQANSEAHFSYGHSQIM